MKDYICECDFGILLEVQIDIWRQEYNDKAYMYVYFKRASCIIQI